jgi:hypothetical protein
MQCVIFCKWPVVREKHLNNSCNNWTGKPV